MQACTTGIRAMKSFIAPSERASSRSASSLAQVLFAVATWTHANFVPAPHSNGGVTFHFAKNGVRGRSLNNWQ